MSNQQPGRAGGGSCLGPELSEARHALERALASVGAVEHAATKRMAELEARVDEQDRTIADLDSDRALLTEKLVESERQGGRLLNLYVAAYQLHATLDPKAVQETIAEICLNLLGAEQFALLLHSDETPGLLDVAIAEGLTPERGGLLLGPHYTGGDQLVDQALQDGCIRIGPVEGSAALCVVPLTVQGSTIGALVVFKLFDHETTPVENSRDLLDLVAAHAASALLAARAYASADRKLRTLEGLMSLVRRER